MTIETVDLSSDNPVIEALTDWLAQNPDTTCVALSSGKAQVKYANGQYKTKDVFSDQEFFWRGVREGKKNQVIFEFYPCDAREYVVAELGGDIDPFRIFGEAFEHLVIGALGFEGDKVTSFKQAAAKFRLEKRKIERKAKEEAAISEAQANMTNPNWGIF